MMAAAGEARAVWQRTANRYFVQEDAKRAPKFTSSSSSSTKQVQQDSVSSPPVVRPQYQSSSPRFMPLLGHHHHHHIQTNQKDQVKTPLEAEVDISDKKPELGAESFKSENFQEFMELMETRESNGLIGSDESSEKKLLNEIPFDPTSPWNPLSSEKAGPWWRTTDRDELASLVAQRSLDFVENCDLPTPQKMKRSSYYGSSPHEQGPSSCKKRTDVSSESDLSKSELLEALRRSQTRAREAENMAKEACAEKEHLVKLLLKQASELFGYKQLMQLLQLEALYLQLQIKSKNIEKSNEQPPWSNSKARKEGEREEAREVNRVVLLV
ncbi:hypothetical protein Bca52824_096407 [Brassica carinata]|uniref:Uncharacterized protein n=1 Tax=Brassica carinata TaxID=52824 RepID=A0A8X7P024_BRACI|nr:hypothetical protein Bca52824_096407 [Brassica carinata]